MNDSPGRAGMALVAAALYLLAWLFVAGVGYVLHLIAGFVWPGYPLETWQTIAATFGIWLVGGGSGHGFKNGPAVGKRVAAHILDPNLPVEPRFSYATKGTSAARTVF